MALLPAIAAAMNDAPPAPSPLEHPPDHIRRWAAGLRAGQGSPEKLRAVEHRVVEGRDRSIPIRIYRPDAMGPVPTIVAAHGGWFAWGDLDILEQPASALAAAADAVVLSVEYALAPEAPFPAGLDDVIDVLTWVNEHIGGLGNDSGRLYLFGESAGATIAAGAAIEARAGGGPRVAGQVLVVPPTDPALDTESWSLFDGSALPKDWARFYWRQYLGGVTPESAPLACPLRVADLTGLPSTFVLTAEYDPLRDEGEAFARRVASAGAATTARRYLGMPHGMLYMNGITEATRAVTQDIASFVNGVSLEPRVEAMDLVLT
jgi:acetyl esterase